MGISRCVGSSCLTAGLLLAGSWLHPAAAQLLGAEFQVNTYITGYQWDPAVAADGSGNFVVVWGSMGQDGSSEGVFGQRFDPTATLVGSEFRINSFTQGYQHNPAVAVDSLGTFVVVWGSVGQDASGEGEGVFGQRYDSAGVRVGSEFRVNSFTTGIQRNPAIAVDGSNKFVVVWESSGQDDPSWGVFGQRFDSAGSAVGGEFLVNSYTTNYQKAPAVVAGVSGNFVVVWESNQDGSSADIFGQRFDAAGIKAGSEFQINSYTISIQNSPALAADGAGNFVVAWQSDGQDGSAYGVFGQRFDSAGTQVGSEFRINTHTTGMQKSAKVAADGAGYFVVTWQSYGQDGSYEGIFGQRIGPAGSKVGREFQINSYTTFRQSSPALVADSAGNFVVVWQNFTQNGLAWGVLGQRLAAAIFADGFELGDACAWSAAVGGGC